MKKYFTIGLLSLSILSTELYWTRLFSAEFFYTFAFLILSLAILGLGLGALFLNLFPKLNKPSVLPVWLFLSGLMILVSVPLVFLLNLDFAKLVTERMQIVKLLGAILLLGSGFFFGGISIAQIFKMDSEEIPRLYMADFLGAALGVIGFIIIMNLFGAKTTLIYCAIPVLAASFINAGRWMKIIPVLILTAGIVFYSINELPEQKREERAKVIHKHWDAVSKIKVYEYDSTYRSINIDNAANTPVLFFDGNWNKPDSMKYGFDVDVSYLMKKFNKCTFLSLGAGGGQDVLQALQNNASEIHAVEVNPYINYLLKEGLLNKFTGNIYGDPRVNVVTEDGRAYIRSFRNKFDIIFSSSSNTFAAFASGSFALAENYLFTTDAVKDYWKALSEKGYMCIEHQFYAPRLVAEVIDALKEMNVADPYSHFAVYNLPKLRRNLVLISKTSLDKETITKAYGELTGANAADIYLLYPQYKKKTNNIFQCIVKNGWRPISDTTKTDISPCTDNRPFIAQMGQLKNFSISKVDTIPLLEISGFPLSKLVMLIIMIVCLVIIVPLNLVPYLFKREKLSFKDWCYFFAIGMGYMMIEVILIQKYTLFIGSSIYSLALTLTVLLLFSGIGSRHSSRYSDNFIFNAIVIWLLADIFIFKELFYLFGSWALMPRLVLSGILIAPLGYFLGMPFPKLVSKIPGFVDWAFAVTGSASVIGSVLIMFIAMSFGYSIALCAGIVMYIFAFLLSKGTLKTISK